MASDRQAQYDQEVKELDAEIERVQTMHGTNLNVWHSIRVGTSYLVNQLVDEGVGGQHTIWMVHALHGSRLAHLIASSAVESANAQLEREANAIR